MTQTRNPTMTDSARHLGSGVYNVGRKLYLFGIGSFAAVGDGARDVFARLVSRGEEAEKRAHDDRDSIVHRTTDSAKELGRFVEEKVQKTVAATLARAGVPSRNEVQDLIARVELLTKKVEALSAETNAE